MMSYLMRIRRNETHTNPVDEAINETINEADDAENHSNVL